MMNLEAPKLRARAQGLRTYMAAVRAAMGNATVEASYLLNMIDTLAGETADALEYLADVADATDRALKGDDPSPKE
jgi:hypothetical protein